MGSKHLPITFPHLKSYTCESSASAADSFGYNSRGWFGSEPQAWNSFRFWPINTHVVVSLHLIWLPEPKAPNHVLLLRYFSTIHQRYNFTVILLYCIWINCWSSVLFDLISCLLCVSLVICSTDLIGWSSKFGLRSLKFLFCNSLCVITSLITTWIVMWSANLILGLSFCYLDWSWNFI